MFHRVLVHNFNKRTGNNSIEQNLKTIAVNIVYIEDEYLLTEICPRSAMCTSFARLKRTYVFTGFFSFADISVLPERTCLFVSFRLGSIWRCRRSFYAGNHVAIVRRVLY